MKILTETEYKAALLKLDRLFEELDAAWDLRSQAYTTEECDQLIKAIVDYEDIHYPIPPHTD